MNSEMQAREVLAGGMDAEFPVTASRLRSIDFETDLFPKGTQVSIRVLTQLLEQRAELLEALMLALSAIEQTTSEMTVGDRFTNAGQSLIDALNPCRAAIANATQQRNATGGEG